MADSSAEVIVVELGTRMRRETTRRTDGGAVVAVGGPAGGGGGGGVDAIASPRPSCGVRFDESPTPPPLSPFRELCTKGEKEDIGFVVDEG